jgi:DNA gyrase inhibitor GyrI
MERRMMEKTEVKIVRLEPIRAISAWGFGTEPETTAWKKLVAWAQPQGMMDAPDERRIFGFNNPNPSPGSPNYGYEFWLTVEESTQPSDDLRVIDFRGGLYAVQEIKVEGDFGEVIGTGWKRLDAWVTESPYRPGNHQWLEEHTIEGLPFALHYPIAE